MKIIIVPEGCSPKGEWDPKAWYMSEEEYKRSQLRLKNKGMKNLDDIFS